MRTHSCSTLIESAKARDPQDPLSVKDAISLDRIVCIARFGPAKFCRRNGALVEEVDRVSEADHFRNEVLGKYR